MRTFRERLIEAMRDRKMTQADLARAAGITRGRISQIVNDGGEPEAGNLFAIADALEYKARWLICGQGPRTKQEAAKDMVSVAGLPEQSKAAVRAVRDSLAGQEKRAG